MSHDDLPGNSDVQGTITNFDLGPLSYLGLIRTLILAWFSLLIGTAHVMAEDFDSPCVSQQEIETFDIGALLDARPCDSLTYLFLNSFPNPDYLSTNDSFVLPSEYNWDDIAPELNYYLYTRLFLWKENLLLKSSKEDLDLEGDLQVLATLAMSQMHEASTDRSALYSIYFLQNRAKNLPPKSVGRYLDSIRSAMSNLGRKSEFRNANEVTCFVMSDLPQVEVTKIRAGQIYKYCLEKQLWDR